MFKRKVGVVVLVGALLLSLASCRNTALAIATGATLAFSAKAGRELANPPDDGSRMKYAGPYVMLASLALVTAGVLAGRRIPCCPAGYTGASACICCDLSAPCRTASSSSDVSSSSDDGARPGIQSAASEPMSVPPPAEVPVSSPSSPPELRPSMTPSMPAPPDNLQPGPR